MAPHRHPDAFGRFSSHYEEIEAERLERQAHLARMRAAANARAEAVQRRQRRLLLVGVAGALIAAATLLILPRVDTLEAALRPILRTADAAENPTEDPEIVEPVADPETLPAQKTALIARYEDVVIRLPVEASALSEISFHQASFGWALPLTTPLKDASVSQAREARGTGHPSAQPHGEDAVLDCSILRLWRTGGRGNPDTAIDVGAPVGAPVIAPVDGTVVLVRPYLLYGRWDDVEIHIRPVGRPDLDVVLLHTSDPLVEAGDEVIGGITKLSYIRKLDDKMPLQLRSYVPEADGGNHVHVQVNDATHPDYKGLEGAIDVPMDEQGHS